MCKTLLSVVLGVMLACAGGAWGFTAWGNYTEDNDWANAANWSGGLPALGNDTWVYIPANGVCRMSGTTSAQVSPYLVVAQGQVGVADIEMIDNASLEVQGNIFMGNSAAGGLAAIGEIRMTDSASLTVTGYIDMGQIGGTNNLYASGDSTVSLPGLGAFVGNVPGTVGNVGLSGNAQMTTTQLVVGQQGTGYLSVADNAVLTISDHFLIGNYVAAAVGQVDISGGQVTAPYVTVGGVGSGTLNMTGGVMNIDGAVTVAGGDFYGHIQLDGGTIYASELNLSLVGTMSVTNGMMVLEGDDWTSTLQGWVNTGQLDASFYFDGADTYIVPEPVCLLLLGLGGLYLRRRN